MNESLFADIPVAPSRVPPFERIRREWNEMATVAGVPTVRKLGDKRKAHLRRRWQEADWREAWPEVLAAIPEIPFCRGQNQRKWRVTLDYVIRNDENYAKVLEWFDRQQTPESYESEDDVRRRDAASAMDTIL